MQIKPTPSNGPTFEEYAKTWLNTFIKSTRKLSTYNRYHHILENQVFPVIGKKPIEQIKRGDIKALLLEQHRKGYSKSSICLVRDVLSGPMDHALDDEIITANPVTGVLKNLQLEQSKRLDVEPLNHEEVALFLETCQRLCPDHHAFFLCTFRTGMRLGELLALEWGDVDWNSKFIKVSKSYKLGQVSTTKTGKDRRVDMSDYLATTLRKSLTEAKKEALKPGKDAPLPYIFNRNGERIEKNYIRRIFKRILTKAGLREIRIHDTRHTYASLLLSMGEPIVYVKEQLGHSKIATTVDIYGHLISSSNRAAVNRLDNPAPICALSAPTKNEKATTL